MEAVTLSCRGPVCARMVLVRACDGARVSAFGASEARAEALRLSFGRQNVSAISAPISLWTALRASIGAGELGQVDRGDDRRALGRPDDRDRVRRSVIAAAGLVADPPTAGSPARSRLSPTLSSISQASSCRRDASESASPRRTCLMSSAIARGLVVSRSSPGVASFRLGSLRSSRVTELPSERANCVKPAGPPIAASTGWPRCCRSSRSPRRKDRRASCRLPQRAFLVTGAYSRRSPGPYAMMRSSRSPPSSTRLSAAAAASNLNVLHIGKRSSARWTSVRPAPVSITKTPRRASALCSIAARRWLASASRSSAEGAAAFARSGAGGGS